MTYIYLDESGDLGFNFERKISKYFIVASMLIHDEETDKKVNRIIKEIRVRKLKKKFKEKSELKFSSTSSIIRKSILKLLSRNDVSIYSIIVNKNKLKEKLMTNKTALYTYLLKMVLRSSFSNIKDNEVTVIIDAVIPKLLRDALELEILTENKELLFDVSKIKIEHIGSLHNLGLQVIDFVAGAIFTKYEYQNLEYYNLVKELIKNEEEM